MYGSGATNVNGLVTNTNSANAYNTGSLTLSASSAGGPLGYSTLSANNNIQNGGTSNLVGGSAQYNAAASSAGNTDAASQVVFNGLSTGQAGQQNQFGYTNLAQAGSSGLVTGSQGGATSGVSLTGQQLGSAGLGNTYQTAGLGTNVNVWGTAPSSAATQQATYTSGNTIYPGLNTQTQSGGSIVTSAGPLSP
jgi:hypothetical protein